jgi:hypothetical protein
MGKFPATDRDYISLMDTTSTYTQREGCARQLIVNKKYQQECTFCLINLLDLYVPYFPGLFLPNSTSAYYACLGFVFVRC